MSIKKSRVGIGGTDELYESVGGQTRLIRQVLPVEQRHEARDGVSKSHPKSWRRAELASFHQGNSASTEHCKYIDPCVIIQRYQPNHEMDYD